MPKTIKDPTMIKGAKGFKIEDGLIKFEYTNKFNIRVNNFKSREGSNYTPLQ